MVTTLANPATSGTASDIDRLVADLNRDGICVLRGLLDRNKLQAWKQAFDQMFEERMNRPGGLAPREKNRYYLTVPWVPPFADEEIFANPTVIAILDRLFPQEYVMVQMGMDIPLNGSEYQETHRDFRPLFTDKINTPLYAVAVNFPLVDVTSENGPFEMALGTHTMGREEALEKVESGEIPMQQFHMQLGDLMIRSPLALHRGTPNKTDQPRPMVVMGFVMHWLHTPKVDVTIPRAYYESLPEGTRKRLRCNVVEELPKEGRETYVEFKY